MSSKKRVPEKHARAIIAIAQSLNGQPRYAIARALVESDAGISMKTALDYVNAAVNEGLLKKVGMNLMPKD